MKLGILICLVTFSSLISIISCDDSNIIKQKKCTKHSQCRGVALIKPEVSPTSTICGCHKYPGSSKPKYCRRTNWAGPYCHYEKKPTTYIRTCNRGGNVQCRGAVWPKSATTYNSNSCNCWSSVCKTSNRPIARTCKYDRRYRSCDAPSSGERCKGQISPSGSCGCWGGICQIRKGTPCIYDTNDVKQFKRPDCSEKCGVDAKASSNMVKQGIAEMQYILNAGFCRFKSIFGGGCDTPQKCYNDCITHGGKP